MKHKLTVGRHEETSVDLFSVTKVRLDFLPAGVELPLMDATGLDVEQVETNLTGTQGRGHSCGLTYYRLMSPEAEAEKISSLGIWWQQHISQKFGRGHFCPLRSVPSSFINSL